jgi:hypothetical protein
MRRSENTFELDFALPIVEQRWARFDARGGADADFEPLADDRTRVSIRTDRGDAEEIAQTFRRFVWAKDTAQGPGGTSAVDTVVVADPRGAEPGSKARGKS